MRQTLHIMRKDLGRLRWLLVLWVALISGRVLLQTADVIVAAEDATSRFAFEQLLDLELLLEVLMMALIAARLIHEDAPARLNAFWLTRPYPRGSLVAAKLLLGVCLLAVVPGLGDVATMIWAKADAGDLFLALPGLLRSHGIWALVFMVVAVLTASLGAFVLAFVGIAAGLALMVTGLMVASLLMADESTGGGGSGPFVADATPGVVATVVFVAAALAVVIYHYRYRRRGRALALAAAGLIATIAVPAYWPWPFAAQPEPDPGPWAREGAPAGVRVDVIEKPEVVNLGRFRGGNAPGRHVNARLEFIGIPPEFSVETVSARAQLDLPEGIQLRSEFTSGLTRVAAFGETAPPTPLQAALGDSILLDDGRPLDGPSYTWSTVLRLSEADYARHRGKSGRFSGVLDLHLRRLRAIGVLPLTTGAALDSGRDRIDVLRVRRRPQGVVAVLRQWHVGSILEAGQSGQYEFVLRNRSRRQAIRIDAMNFGSGPSVSSGVGGILAPLALALARERGFRANYYVLEAPRPGRQGPTLSQVDDAWLDGAELVVVETTQAGRVTRPVTVEDFPIPAG